MWKEILDENQKFSDIPIPVKTALNTLSDAGYQAYIVGGCVRDILLSRVPNDYDITTSALPEDVSKFFSQYKIIDTGQKHGSLSVTISNMVLEITTFRVESAYSDKRHPDHISYTLNLKEDLLRRDFTINALAYNDQEGLIDCFDGRSDLYEKRIRCIGTPMIRFSEDPLRILRALRFSSTLGFEIEGQTLSAALILKELINSIPLERKTEEFQKILCGNFLYFVMRHYHKILTPILPGIDVLFLNDENSQEEIKATEKVLQGISCLPPCFVSRFVALVAILLKHQNGTGICAESIFEKLKFTKKIRNKILLLLPYIDHTFSSTLYDVRKVLRQIGCEEFYNLLEIQKVLSPIYPQFDKLYFDSLFEIMNELLHHPLCLSYKTLKINGYDLMRLGVSDGKTIGILLEHLLDAVMRDIIPNEKNALLNYVIKIFFY